MNVCFATSDIVKRPGRFPNPTVAETDDTVMTLATMAEQLDMTEFELINMLQKLGYTKLWEDLSKGIPPIQVPGYPQHKQQRTASVQQPPIYLPVKQEPWDSSVVPQWTQWTTSGCINNHYWSKDHIRAEEFLSSDKLTLPKQDDTPAKKD